MPRPLPLSISSNKKDLLKIFSPYLLARSHGFNTFSSVSKELIRKIIVHKSFRVAFIWYEKISPIDIDVAINNLVESIYNYLNGNPFLSQLDYDRWLRKTGRKFLLDCSSFKSFKFGKAQKIINVTMKHLYCYNISEAYFDYCHIALDSMTYTGRPKNALDRGFYKNEVNTGATTKAFSNLIYCEYIKIQKKMRKYLSTGSHGYVDTNTRVVLTPFKAEFYIWSRYKK